MQYACAAHFSVPPAIDPFVYAAPEAAHDAMYGFPAVRIWGWSKDGKAAYSTECGIEGRGGMILQYCIYDFTRDTIIAAITIDSFDYTIEEAGDAMIFALYAAKKDEIQTLMRIHAIAPQETPFLPFPIQKDKKQYTYTIDIEYEDTPEFYDTIKKYTVSITTDGKRKTIKTAADVSALNVYCCGYFISPLKNWAVIILAEERWGFEGTELVYGFSGCNLNTDF